MNVYIYIYISQCHLTYQILLTMLLLKKTIFYVILISILLVNKVYNIFSKIIPKQKNFECLFNMLNILTWLLYFYWFSVCILIFCCFKVNLYSYKIQNFLRYVYIRKIYKIFCYYAYIHKNILCFHIYMKIMFSYLAYNAISTFLI